MTLFGRNASLPKLRDLSLSAVHVDWDRASVSYRDLRKLELKNLTFDTGPSFEQFNMMLSSSPCLECLDVSGFCPEPEWGSVVPVIYLPALRDFTFGWKGVRLGCGLLQMFQIGDSLENLTLIDTNSGFELTRPEKNKREECGRFQNSREIFNALRDLGSKAPQSKEGTPPGPFISMRRVRSLRIFWATAPASSSVPLMAMLTELEDIWLEDVDEKVLKGVASALVKRGSPSRFNIRWVWRKAVPDPAMSPISQLENAGWKEMTDSSRHPPLTRSLFRPPSACLI